MVGKWGNVWVGGWEDVLDNEQHMNDTHTMFRIHTIVYIIHHK